jgi:hypothetical protein
MSHTKTLKITPNMFRSSDDHHQGAFWCWLKSLGKIWVFKCGYAAAYVHSFCVLYCVERHVHMCVFRSLDPPLQCVKHTSYNLTRFNIHAVHNSCSNVLHFGRSCTPEAILLIQSVSLSPDCWPYSGRHRCCIGSGDAACFTVRSQATEDLFIFFYALFVRRIPHKKWHCGAITVTG